MNIEEDLTSLKEVVAIRKERCHGFIDSDSCLVSTKRLENLLTAYEKEKEKNKNAYREANNYLYFNDSADYEVALWEVIRTLRPDLADKWDNGEDAVLEYIEEE
jgi:hypothetical protein